MTEKPQDSVSFVTRFIEGKASGKLGIIALVAIVAIICMMVVALGRS